MSPGDSTALAEDPSCDLKPESTRSPPYPSIDPQPATARRDAAAKIDRTDAHRAGENLP
jgi:hypothetical protein